jgi:hypothetical protein
MTNTIEIDRAVWKIESVSELYAFEDKHPELKFPVTMRGFYAMHLKMDYSDSPGAARLGYKPIRPILFISPTTDGRVYADAVVVCDIGCLSRDEALGTEYIPTPEQIRIAARDIKRKNRKAGLRRDDATARVDIGRSSRAIDMAVAS